VQTLEPHRRQGEMLTHSPTIRDSQQAGIALTANAFLDVAAAYFCPYEFMERKLDRVEIGPSAQSKDATEQEVVAESRAAMLMRFLGRFSRGRLYLHHGLP
jgi:hypothetical protein